MNRNHTVRSLASAAVPLIASFLGALSVQAQTAEITGRVTDATGAVVPGTNITVTSVGTGAERKVSANQDGYYAVPLLLPGAYVTQVDHSGFKRITRSGVVLEVDQRAEINFTLEVGGVAEHIEVQAGTELLNTVEASQGQPLPRSWDDRHLCFLPHYHCYLRFPPAFCSAAMLSRRWPAAFSRNRKPISGGAISPRRTPKEPSFIASPHSSSLVPRPEPHPVHSCLRGSRLPAEFAGGLQSYVTGLRRRPTRSADVSCQNRWPVRTRAPIAVPRNLLCRGRQSEFRPEVLRA